MENNKTKYIDAVLSEIQTIATSYTRINKFSGQNFNLFSLLRKEREEVKLHSKFISELLNPQGSHDQGSVFLDCFLETVNIKNFNTKNARSETEYYIGVINKDKTSGGNIDILIRSEDNKVIKIENKIDAGEQENQLLRYHNFQSDGNLIFLTLFGKESEHHKELIAKKIKYKQVSYNNHITKWLQKCINKSATVPIVRESIVQYLNLVKKITNQNINQKMSAEIAKKVIKNKESFEAYLAIRKTENDNKFYYEVVKSHLIPFLEKFAKNNELEVEGLNESLIEKREQYSGFSFIDSRLQSYGIELTVQFGKSLNRDMYYGLSFITENPEENPIYKIIEEEAKKIMDKPDPRNSWWLCSTFWKEYKDWGDINTLYNMVYDNFQKEFSSKLKVILTMTYSVIENTKKQKNTI